MKKLTTHGILSLIKEEESRYLDFKLQHHDNSAELIHDILCLSNSDYSGDRYILFGIDDDKKIHGIANNKKQADLVDCLRSSNFNILPTLSLYSVDINKVKIDIIHIANSPNKPYFLLKDKSVKGVKIRAGVIYTRDNDSNTPKNSTASVTQIEKMWRERFGLDKSPLERVRNYLFDIPGWHSADKNEFYYQSFPEFRIVVEKEPLRKDFFEYWINKEDPCKLAMAEAKIYFHNTVIKKYDIINLEHKTYFPVPEYFDPENAHKNGKAYILVQNIENFVCAIMRETKDIKSYKWAFIHRNGFNTPVEVYHHYLRLHFLTHNLNLQLINKEELEAINKEVRF